MRASIALVMLAAAVVCVDRAPAQAPARADADSMQTKIERVTDAAAAERPANARPLRTTFTEREINAYLALDGSDFLPAGVASPRVRLQDGGRVHARAVVDLDAVRRARERSLLDPLAYLTGSLEVVAAGTVEGEDGEGVIRYESATVGGVAVPKTVAQELLKFYTRTPERPNGFAFDEPFVLPAGVRAVRVDGGAATVTQ